MVRRLLSVFLVILAVSGAALVPTLVSGAPMDPPASLPNRQPDATTEPGDAPTPTPTVFQLPGAPDDLGILIMPTATSAGVQVPLDGLITPGQDDDLGILPVTGGERLTILLLGTDTRPGEVNAYPRTDSIMLISLDRATNHVGVLGIPRDLWVQIPGYGAQRINLAYGMGETWGAGYGPQVIKDTIRATFGISVDHYVLLDFTTFETLIDLIGGIDVVVDEPINDPTYPDASYGYDPFYLEAGEQHLDGATALKYVRSRHNSDDRVRVKRQQQVMLAVLEKVTAPEWFPVMLREMPEIWDAVTEGVRTDLTLAQVMDLALLARSIPPENIVGEVMDWRYAVPTFIADQSVLVPNYATLPALIAELFGPNYSG